MALKNFLRSETVLNICKHSQERVCKKSSENNTSPTNHYIEPDKWKHDSNGFVISKRIHFNLNCRKKVNFSGRYLVSTTVYVTCF